MSKIEKLPKIDCCLIFLTILIPPLGLLCQKTRNVRDRNIIINLIITILLPGVGIIHAFYLLGLSCCISTSCLFLPFLGVFLKTKKFGKFCLCFFLSFLFFLPGVVYAYSVCVNFEDYDGEVTEGALEEDAVSGKSEIEINF